MVLLASSKDLKKKLDRLLLRFESKGIFNKINVVNRAARADRPPNLAVGIECEERFCFKEESCNPKSPKNLMTARPSNKLSEKANIAIFNNVVVLPSENFQPSEKISRI